MKDQRMKASTALTVLATCALTSCTQRSPAPAAQPSTPDALPAFVGKVWVSTTPGMARGTIKVFLPDKTVLMDSCFETFRLEKWGVMSADTIRWVEDRIPIEARYEQPRPDALHLHISGREDVETYIAAGAPYLCPDMPR